MNLTGARWSLKGAEAALGLRALRSSGDFDEYWRFHERAEYERNHAALYADHHVPATVRPREPATTLPSQPEVGQEAGTVTERDWPSKRMATRSKQIGGCKGAAPMSLTAPAGSQNSALVSARYRAMNCENVEATILGSAPIRMWTSEQSGLAS